MALSKPKLLPQTLVSLIALFLMLLASKVHSQGTSTQFQFDSFTLSYQGDAHVPSDATFLRLTQTDASGTVPSINSIGRVLYSLPVQLWGEGTQATFETTIKFLIRSSENGAADGLAFFIVPAGSTIPSGSAAGNLGIFDSSGSNSPLVAVEFDTWVNQWDPNYRHIGIDINSRNSVQATEFDAVGQEVTAYINYDPRTTTLSVRATDGSGTSRVSYVIDLSTVLPEQVQVGISASNGEPAENDGIFNVLSWSFDSTLLNITSSSGYGAARIRQYV